MNKSILFFLFILISGVFSIHEINTKKSVTPPPSTPNDIYLLSVTNDRGQIIEIIDLETGKTKSTLTFDTNYKTQEIITMNSTNMLAFAIFDSSTSIVSFDLETSQFRVVHTLTNKFEKDQHFSSCLVNNTIYFPIVNVTYPEKIITVLGYNLETSEMSSVDFQVTFYESGYGVEPSITYDSNNDLMYIFYDSENNDLSILEYKLSDPVNTQKLYQFIEGLDSGFTGVDISLFGSKGQFFIGYEDTGFDFNWGILNLKTKELKQTETVFIELPDNGEYLGELFFVSKDGQQLIFTNSIEQGISIDIYEINNHFSKSSYLIPNNYMNDVFLFFYK